MQKRGYSIESIAGQTDLKPHEVEKILAPYMPRKMERSMAQ
jgi:hypothetical protein